jgi:hypothetical protein
MIATSFLSHSSATDYSDSPEYLDIQPLTLSGHGDLDDFDFLLDVEDNDALTSTSEDGMDLVHQFETLESSLNSMHFHTIEETISCSSAEEEDMLPLPSFSNDGYYQTKRNQGQHHQQQQYFRVHHQVNFDPPMQCQQQPQQADLPRQASVSDMSMCSYATAHSSATFSHHHHHQQQPSHHDAAAQRSSSFLHSEAQQQQHHKLVDQAQQIGEALQLQKLAESMQRTELSRKQVMLHRDSMPVEQRRRQLRALREIKEAQQQQRDHDQVHHHHYQRQSQYQVQNHEAQQQIQHQMQQQHTSHSSEDGCCNHQQHRSSIVAAFFSGSRSTLTNGLELSRRQLGLYMSTI